MDTKHFRVQEHILPAQHIREHPRATAEGHAAPVHLAIKHYIPLENPTPKSGDVTIIAMGGNAFPKELYEPLWDDLQHMSNQGKSVRIRGIWIADMSNQGASGQLNEGNMGNEPSWDDHSRDVLHMINVFRDEMPVPLVGIGHSLGACQLVNLSLIHPGLFTTLVLIEPYIQAVKTFKTLAAGHNLVVGSLSRRHIWPNWADAAARFKKHLKDWDQRVVGRYIHFGLRELPTSLYPRETSDPIAVDPKSVTLMTLKHQEALMMLIPMRKNLDSTLASSDGEPLKSGQASIYTRLIFRTEPVRVMAQLPLLRPSVFFVFGSQSPMSTHEARLEKLGTTGTGIRGSVDVPKPEVASTVLNGYGHLVPFQAVEACAIAAHDWLVQALGKWRCEDNEHTEEWISKDKKYKMTLDRELRNKLLSAELSEIVKSCDTAVLRSKL